MKHSEFLARLAGSSAALVQDYDLTGMLVRTIGEAATAVGADSGGLLVVNSRRELELLSATSHAAVALETYQAFGGEGPCRECVTQLVAVVATRAEVSDRWPAVAGLMEAAGYDQVVATPLLWRGAALGGLNLFFTDRVADVETVQVESQVFADVLTLFIVNAEPITPVAARERIDAALEVRAVIEQAKGVLAEQQDITMADAYLRLREVEKDTGRSLSEAARSVILAAQEERRRGTDLSS